MVARHVAWALAALFMTGGALSAAGHDQVEQKPAPQKAVEPRRDSSHDRGPWWKASATVAEIGISADQSATIDQIFRTEIERMKPLREEVMQLEKALDKMMQANMVDVSVVAQEAARIETKRAELNKMRTVMLYRMRRVLNTEQNARFQAYWDRREAERRKLDGDRRR